MKWTKKDIIKVLEQTLKPSRIPIQSFTQRQNFTQKNRENAIK